MDTKIRFKVSVLSVFVILLCTQALKAADSLQQDSLVITEKTDTLKKLSFWAAVNDVISSVRGIDTNYVSVPEYPFMISALYSGTNINNTLISPELNDVEFPSIKMHLNIPFRHRAGVGFSYRGLGIKYFTDLSGSTGSKMFSLELLKRKFGVDIKYYNFNSVPATVSFTMDGQRYSINTDDVAQYGVSPGGFELNTFVVSGYYIINARKFSYPAAMKYNTVQKRTAGGFFIQACYNYSRIDASNCFIFDNYFNNKTFEYTNNRLALGFGYGLNIVPAAGKFMIHVSVAPMAELHFNSNLNIESNPISDQLPEDLRKKMQQLAEHMNELASAASNNSKLDFTVSSRVAAVYNISKRFVFGINANFGYTDYGTKNTFRQTYYDVNVNASFGYRFGF